MITYLDIDYPHVSDLAEYAANAIANNTTLYHITPKRLIELAADHCEAAHSEATFGQFDTDEQFRAEAMAVYNDIDSHPTLKHYLQELINGTLDEAGSFWLDFWEIDYEELAA